MEAGSVTGIIVSNDISEDSDVSLLAINDEDDETVDDASDVDANPRIPDAAVTSDGTASNPVMLLAAEVGCHASETSSSLPLAAGLSSDAPGNATQDAVMVSANESSCTRHRRSHRRHHRSGTGSSRRSRHRLCRFKRKESNYISATCHVIVIVLVCIALANPRWFYIQGGRCTDASQSIVSYLAVKTFFYEGSVGSAVFANRNAYFYGNSLHSVLLDCVTSDAVFVMRVIISLCMFVLFFCAIAFLMDVLGPTHAVCRAIRFTASLSILSACACVVIVGLCYMVAEQLSHFYVQTQLGHAKVLVQFSLGFYIVTAAGAMSVIGVASTLLRRVRGTSSRTSSSSSGGGGGSRSGGSSSRRGCLSRGRQPVDADLDRLVDAACPSTERTPPPYRR